MKHINVKLCCNNLLQAVKMKTVNIYDGEFCLGETKYQLKEPTKEYDTAIIKIFFCPWCGQNLSKITAEIKQQMKLEESNALGRE